MAEQFTKPYKPQASYGSSAVNNRVRPGGTLGSNQYYYVTDAKTGEITINRYITTTGDSISIGTIPQGKTFTPSSNASSAEKSHYGLTPQVGKVRSQALQIARREWDGRTQPAPTNAIYGQNSINQAFDPPGSSTPSTSVRNTKYSGSPANPSSFIEGANSILDSFGGGGILGSLLGSGRGGSRGGVVVYPSAIRTSGQDYIKIEQLIYKPKKKGKSGLGWEHGGRSGTRGGVKLKDRQPQGSIILPIPGGINDSSQVSWGQDKMTPTETALANIAMEGIEGGMGGALDEMERTAAAARAAGGDVKKALAKSIAGMASGTGAQLLSRTEGQILNPNMELLFKDPSLRPFNFAWKLAPRSAEEAQNVIKIIRFFKQGMAPSKSKSNLFLKSPNTWKITYMHKGSPHKYLNKFKECAMNSFTVAYTPDGNYATFEDGVMTAYQITMGLQELEPIFSNDYEGLPGIGF